ncbi:MAG: hypothetical protein LBT40_06305 [Deltaproteobacteria bacterium]|nr:hypothetical protein [Deltaproteobacteria bacterium]
MTGDDPPDLTGTADGYFPERKPAGASWRDWKAAAGSSRRGALFMISRMMYNEPSTIGKTTKA